ncbi:MAG TPA: O-antigen ligase family protein, partial [Bacteroidia bacterium]|nr:O-antigen ligase family protein [Bacteroidia bacterium]
ILSFFALKYVLDKKNVFRVTTFLLVAIMLATMFIFSFIYKILDSDLHKITDHWERSVLWESAIKASPNYILGVGTGDYKKVLNQFYRDHNMLAYADLSYNAHNQFIQVFFSNGLLGLICLVILLGRPFYMSIKRQYLLGALIFFPFFIYGMTEVFLGRFQGVVFFALLHQSFIVFYEKSGSYQKML